MKALQPPTRARHPGWFALIPAVLVMACGQSPTDPADRLSVREESAHYVYLHAAGDAVDISAQERYHEWLLGQLALGATEKLEYRKYRDRAHMRRVTGRNTNGFAEPGTIRFHSIWPFDNHECVHALVTMHLGHPPALFNEGIAVAHQAIPVGPDLAVRWNGQPLDQIAADRLRAGQLPTLDQVIESPHFFDLDENLAYPVSGSFVRYLLDHHGWAPMKAYLGTSAFGHSAAQTRTAFRAAYGFSLDEAWNAWRATLTSAAVQTHATAPGA